MNILLLILKGLAWFLGITGIIYWFNLDMKLIYKITPFMKKHYDSLERDQRL